MAKQTALRLIPEMTDHTDDKDRPTDRVHAAPEPPIDFANPAFPPSAIVPHVRTDPDPMSWADVQLKALVDGVEEIRAGRKEQDIPRLLAQQTAEIKERLDVSDRRNQTNYNLVVDQVRGLVHAHDAAAIRVGHLERGQESHAEKLERMAFDFAAFQEQVKQRMSIMAAEIAAMKPATA